MSRSVEAWLSGIGSDPQFIAHRRLHRSEKLCFRGVQEGSER